MAIKSPILLNTSRFLSFISTKVNKADKRFNQLYAQAPIYGAPTDTPTPTPSDPVPLYGAPTDYPTPVPTQPAPLYGAPTVAPTQPAPLYGAPDTTTPTPTPRSTVTPSATTKPSKTATPTTTPTNTPINTPTPSRNTYPTKEEIVPMYGIPVTIAPEKPTSTPFPEVISEYPLLVIIMVPVFFVLTFAVGLIAFFRLKTPKK